MSLNYRKKTGIKSKLVLILALMWLLTGCSQKPLVYYPLHENTETRLSEIPLSERRAEGKTTELCVAMGTEEEPDESVIAEAAGVFSEHDKRVLVQKNVYERLYPASITKVMTALIALKYGNLSDVVTVGNEVIITEPGASMCHVQPGDQITLEQLLYGLMLPSGNDAGAAIAVHMAGSIEAFADLMNKEAESIGALGSHFINPHGLHDETHYTTAYDLYLIFREAMKYEIFRDIIGTTKYEAVYHSADGSEVRKTWDNSNQYLSGKRKAPDGLIVLGGKTGTTKAAGYCLLMASQDAPDHLYISVILKSDNRDHLYEGMTKIIQKIRN